MLLHAFKGDELALSGFSDCFEFQRQCLKMLPTSNLWFGPATFDLLLNIIASGAWPPFERFLTNLFKEWQRKACVAQDEDADGEDLRDVGAEVLLHSELVLKVNYVYLEMRMSIVSTILSNLILSPKQGLLHFGPSTAIGDMFHKLICANNTRYELCAQQSVSLLKRCCNFSEIFMASGGEVFLEEFNALDTTPAEPNDLEDGMRCNEKKIEMKNAQIEVTAGLHSEEHFEKACEKSLANKTRFDLQLVITPLLCKHL